MTGDPMICLSVVTCKAYSMVHVIGLQAKQKCVAGSELPGYQGVSVARTAQGRFAQSAAPQSPARPSSRRLGSDALGSGDSRAVQERLEGLNPPPMCGGAGFRRPAAHADEELGDALVLEHAGVGAGQEQREARLVRLGGQDPRAADHPFVPPRDTPRPWPATVPR